MHHPGAKNNVSTTCHVMSEAGKYIVCRERREKIPTTAVFKDELLEETFQWSSGKKFRKKAGE